MTSARRTRRPMLDGVRPPVTVSRRALLPDGSGGRFRQLVSDLLTISVRMLELRNHLATLMRVTGPQYSIVLTVAYFQATGGASVRAVAHQLHVSSAFITSETGKLVHRGYLAKRPNPADRRSVLLTLTRRGAALVESVVPHIRAVNDTFFGALSARDFNDLSRMLGAMVTDSERALSGARLRHAAVSSAS